VECFWRLVCGETKRGRYVGEDGGSAKRPLAPRHHPSRWLRSEQQRLAPSPAPSRRRAMNDHPSPLSYMDGDRSSSPRRKKMRQKYAPKACTSRPSRAPSDVLPPSFTQSIPTVPRIALRAAAQRRRRLVQRQDDDLADSLLQACRVGDRSSRWVHLPLPRPSAPPWRPCQRSRHG
jgi:hypothetical protein